MIELTLVQNDDADFYRIVRVNHKGERWYQDVKNCCGRVIGSRLMLSERISPEADIEGTSEELLELASAIERWSESISKRCAVEFMDDYYYIWSPKNSDDKLKITVETAFTLSETIRRILKK